MLEGRRRRPERRMPERRRRRSPERRRWWWPRGLMRVKAPTMSKLGGSSPLRVVQCLSLLLPTIMYLLLIDFCCKYMLNLCEQLNLICVMHEHDIIIYNYMHIYCGCMWTCVCAYMWFVTVNCVWFVCVCDCMNLFTMTVNYNCVWF
jgi:hypothetical protein